MDRANKKTETVKQSMETVKGKIDNFKLIPGFSKYEFNGVICRNAKTKSIMSLKIKNNKYQLISDDGKNIDKSKEQLAELIGPVKQVKKEPKVKSVKVKKVVDENVEPKKKSTMFMVNLLFHQGKNQEEIKSELGITNKQYLDSQWHYLNRGYKEKIEKYLENKCG